MNQKTKTAPAEKYTRVGEMFTDGAMCAPLKRQNPETGKTEWVWIVTNFAPDADCYMDGHEVIPEYCASTREELISDFLEHAPEEKVLFSNE